jgi:hypothetical protein
MQAIFDTARAAFTLLLMLIIGWTLVFIVGSIVERKVRRARPGDRTFFESFAWVWDNANLIGIPTLIVGTLYMYWAMNYGPGIGGPSMLILLLMGAAALLIGFAPSLRRR